MKKVYSALALMAACAISLNAQAEDTWKTVGEATFMDGWLQPLYGLDQTDEANQYEVELQQNTENGNLYRLVNPYKSGPLAEYNEFEGDAYLQVDVTDPENVRLKIQPSGFADSYYEIESFHCLNYLAYLTIYYADYGYDEDYLIEWYAGWMPTTTYEEGVVYFGSFDDPDYGYTPDVMYTYDANLAVHTNYSANLDAKITFHIDEEGEEGETPESGIVNVAASQDNNAPVEYFNLQGVRINNPAAGQVVIRRQGTEVAKVQL